MDDDQHERSSLVEFSIPVDIVGDNPNGDGTSSVGLSPVSSGSDLSTIISSKSNDKLPFGSSKLIWKNLSFEVEKKKFFNLKFKKQPANTQTILKPQSGHLKCGTITAILGPSGSGKTTLLNCLMGRFTIGLKGRVLIQKDDDHRNLETNISFIPQKNYLVSTLTVRETLVYASRLKNSGKKNLDHESLADGIIKELLLNSCSHLKVSKISGGQTKRLSIGVELVSRPTFIALDEPTSGLDSFTSYSCVSLLRQLTRTDGPGIIASVHQPNSKLFSLFDFVYILSYTGSCIYYGPPSELIISLSNVGLNCPSYYNPSDFAIDVSHGDHGYHVIEKLEDMVSSNNNVIIMDKSGDKSTEDADSISSFESLNEALRKSSTNTSKPFIDHFWILLNRSFLIMFREPMIFWTKLFQSILIALCLSFLWGYPIGLEDGCWADSKVLNKSIEVTQNNILSKIKNVTDNSVFLFTSLIYMVIASATSTVMTFPFEMQVVMKETFNNWYDCGTYFLAKTMATIPIELMYSSIFSISSYILTGQYLEPNRLFWFWAQMVLMALTSEAMASIFGIWLYKEPMTAVFVAPTTCVLLMVFGGYLVRYDQMPAFLKPVAILSYMRYGFHNVLTSIYGFGRCETSTNATSSHQSLMPSFTSLLSSSGPIDMSGKNLKLFTSAASPVLAYQAGVDQKSFSKTVNFLIDFFKMDKEVNANQSSSSSIVSTRISSPSYVLSFFEVDESQFYVNFLALFCFLVIFKLFAYLILVIRTKTGGNKRL